MADELAAHLVTGYSGQVTVEHDDVVVGVRGVVQRVAPVALLAGY